LALVRDSHAYKGCEGSLKSPNGNNVAYLTTIFFFLPYSPLLNIIEADFYPNPMPSSFFVSFDSAK